MRGFLRFSALSLLCAGCPGQLEDLSRFDLGADAQPDGSSQCSDVPKDLFVKVCAVSGCHSTAAKAGALDLEAPDPGSRLVGACAQGGLSYLIDPDKPDQSVLYTKLTPTPPFGLRMPEGATALTPDQLACVLSWTSAQNGDRRACDNAGAPPPIDAGKD